MDYNLWPTNDAQSGKDVCGTHFSDQQMHVDNYLVPGEGGRYPHLSNWVNHLLNTTALLVKLDFKAPYRSAVVPSVSGISDFYAAQYGTTVDKEKSSNFTTVWGRRYKQCHLMLR